MNNLLYVIVYMGRKRVISSSNSSNRVNYLYNDYIERHKELLVIGSVREYLGKYGEEECNRFLYSLELIYNTESKFYRLSYNDRVKEIGRHIYGDEGILISKMRDYSVLVNDIERLYDVIELRYLRAWERKVEERIEFLESINYSISNAKLIDDLMMRSKDLLEQKRSIKNLIIQEKKGKIKGGQKLSLLAEGKIVYDKAED